MHVIDSRKLTVQRDTPVYVTSEPKDSKWGQPPASHYVFTVVGTRLFGEPIAGVYLIVSSSDIWTADSLLVAEFEAWERASDEALTSFEAMLD